MLDLRVAVQAKAFDTEEKRLNMIVYLWNTQKS